MSGDRRRGGGLRRGWRWRVGLEFEFDRIRIDFDFEVVGACVEVDRRFGFAGRHLVDRVIEVEIHIEIELGFRIRGCTDVHRADLFCGRRIESGNSVFQDGERLVIARLLDLDGSALPGVHRFDVLAVVRVGLAEFLQRRTMVRILRDDTPQTRDRLVTLAISQIDIGFGEQLIRISFRKSLAIDGRLRFRRHHCVGFPSDVRAARSVRPVRIFMLVRRGQKGLLLEKLIIAELGFGDIRDVHFESTTRFGVPGRQALHEFACLLLVTAVAIQLGEAPYRVCQFGVVATLGVEIDQQLILSGLGRHIQGAHGERLGSIDLAGGHQVSDQRGKCFDFVGPEFEDAFLHGGQLFMVSLGLEFLGDRHVFRQRLALHPLLTKEFRHLQSAGGIRRVERRGLTQEVERIGLAALTVVAVRRGLERTDRL